MYRYLHIYYKDKTFYQNAKNEYQKNIKKAHNRLLRIKFFKHNENKINLIGFDGSIKKTYKRITAKLFDNISKTIDKMPLGYMKPGMKISKTKKQPGLSLYVDYNPKTTLKGTGFKNAETADKTIQLIKNRDLTYQKRVILTMYNRAKFHPYRTNDMEKAMVVFKKWLDSNK